MDTVATAFKRALRMLLMAQSELDRAVLQRRANQMKQLAPDMPREDMLQKIQEASAQDDIEAIKIVGNFFSPNCLSSSSRRTGANYMHHLSEYNCFCTGPRG